jgi:DNA-binding transcriptional ArsR family regulator
MASKSVEKRGGHHLGPPPNKQFYEDGKARGAIGNPGHTYDPQIAAKVKLCRALGMVADTIGEIVGLSGDTIMRHYQAEYERGLVEANMKVGAAIFSSALGEEVECATCNGTKRGANDRRCDDCLGKGRIWIREPSPTSQIWWSKNLMGWTDQQRIEHTGPGGGPILTEHVKSGDRVKARLESIRARLEAKKE